MKLSNLVGETATAVVHVGPAEDDNVTVVYRPGALTLETADKLVEARNSDFAIRAVEELLRPLLVSWDLTDDEGNEIPCNEETLKKVPLNFLGMLVEQITMDNRPTPEEGKGSGDGSQQAES